MNDFRPLFGHKPSFLKKRKMRNFANEKHNRNRMCIYLPLEEYLAEWFRHETGSGDVVQLIRGSQESEIVKQFISIRPENVPVENGIEPVPEGKVLVPIIIPEQRLKPAISYNYLMPAAKEALADCIRSRFKIQLFHDLHRVQCIGKRQDNLIYAWLEQHGMNIDRWDTVAKIYQRMRKSYLSTISKKKAMIS